jgi:hypothetical protein
MGVEPAGNPDTSIHESDINPEVFFESAYQVFQRAEQTTGFSIERFYNISGYCVCLRFAGSALIPYFTQALEHLATESISKPALTVCVWDDISTQTQMPPPPWAGYAVYTRRGDVKGFSNDRICTAYNWSANALSLLDKKTAIALYWTHDIHLLPSYKKSAPLRTIFHWWMNLHGRQFVHGGAVGTSDGGVLLAGKGGSGKSTTVLSCLNNDMLYVSDDYCLISADPGPFAFSIYSSAKLNADNIKMVPHLMPTLSNYDSMDKEKAVFFLYPYFAKKITAGFPVRAILLPCISGRRETILTPASSVDALKALALSTMSQLAGAGRESLQIMHQLVRLVPCYHLNLGTDLTRIPEVITGLLKKAVSDF